jgi:hypothetical protein
MVFMAKRQPNGVFALLAVQGQGNNCNSEFEGSEI